MAGDPNSTEVLALEGEIDLHRSPQLKQEFERARGKMAASLKRQEEKPKKPQ